MVPYGRARKGFTLIELLVVIAIIAILAAILLPVFSTARQMAQRTVCLSQVKQMGCAALMYAQDHDDAGPLVVQPRAEGYWFWHVSLQPYLKNWDVLRCPSCRDNEGDPQGMGTCRAHNPFIAQPLSWKAGSGSYGWNACALGSPYIDWITRKKGWAGVALAAVGSPAQTLMIAEISKTAHAAEVFPPAEAVGAASSAGMACPSDAHRWSNFADRHTGGNSVLFFDGHVKCLKKAEVARHPEWFAPGY